ncbi:LysR substrate-binding domain-containing protein [Actinophytocola sediminis]
MITRWRAGRRCASTTSPTSRFITAREGHRGRGLLDRLFAARGRTPRIVCEVDEHRAIADLIGAGLGVGFVPAASPPRSPVSGSRSTARTATASSPCPGVPATTCRPPPG